MTHLFRKHPFVVSAFALAVLVSVFLIGRILVQAVYWSQHSEVAIEPWMTVGYIGRSWNVPPREVDERAGLPKPESGHPFTLDQIAKDRGVPVAEIIALVEQTIADIRAEREKDKTK